jgi:glycine/D-amino acid oxidase-like deaminating enzyme
MTVLKTCAPPPEENFRRGRNGGAGVFGAWTALHLRRSGRTVALLDAYGAGNSRSSSGGESRIIRMGYGADEIYTRWAMRSRELWTELFDQVGRPELFQKTGVLWTPARAIRARPHRNRLLRKCGVAFQETNASGSGAAFPATALSRGTHGPVRAGVRCVAGAASGAGGGRPSGSRRCRI